MMLPLNLLHFTLIAVYFISATFSSSPPSNNGRASSFRRLTRLDSVPGKRRSASASSSQLSLIHAKLNETASQDQRHLSHNKLSRILNSKSLSIVNENKATLAKKKIHYQLDDATLNGIKSGIKSSKKNAGANRNNQINLQSTKVLKIF
jgi:hypothetical protein